jgi:hypothetical protein
MKFPENPQVLHRWNPKSPVKSHEFPVKSQLFWMNSTKDRLLRGADHGPVAHHIGTQLLRLEPAPQAASWALPLTGYHKLRIYYSYPPVN